MNWCECVFILRAKYYNYYYNYDILFDTRMIHADLDPSQYLSNGYKVLHYDALGIKDRSSQIQFG